MKLTIVVPVYNEITTLEEIVKRILAVEIDGEKELVLIDDGSTDGTRNLYDKIKQDHPEYSIDVLLQEQNRGKGAAIRAGFTRATGDIVLVQDADLEYDPRDYPQLIAPIIEGKADVVYGSRFVGGGTLAVSSSSGTCWAIGS